MRTHAFGRRSPPHGSPRPCERRLVAGKIVEDADFRSFFFKQFVRNVTSKEGKVLKRLVNTVERCFRRFIQREQTKIKIFRYRADSNEKKKMSDDVEIIQDV